MIRAVGLAKSFADGTVAVEDATFDVGPGEVLALLGANGAGKTTTLHMLLGLLAPTRGEALVDGVDVRRDPVRACRRIGYVSENVQLYGNLSAVQNLRFFARVSGDAVPESRVQALLARVGLADAQHRRVRTFSKGMRQRLGLAVALVKDPSALVLDEPTTGLDPEGADALLVLVRELRDERRAVLLSTHDVHRVLDVATKVAVMAAGRVRVVVAREDVEGGDVDALYRRHSGRGVGRS